MAACGWHVVASPNGNTSNNFLYSVAAVSASNVWAGGYYYSAPNYKTLMEHWNGSSWSIAPSPNVSHKDNFVNSVAAVSASDVWAVGYTYATGSPNQTLIEHWNGSSWSVVPSPNGNTSGNILYSVARVSSSSVWAVGYDSNGSVNKTLTERWNGTSWTVVPSANANNSYNILTGVAAISNSNVWAVGNDEGSGMIYSTLTEHLERNELV